MTDPNPRGSGPDARGASEFDTDTAVEVVGEGRFKAALSGRWSIGPALNGGYGLAVALRALLHAVGQPHPLSVTGHFLGPLVEGPAEIDVGVVKPGRTLSTAEAAVRQDGRERLRVLALVGSLPDDPEPLLVDGSPPELPPPEDCVGNEPGGPNPYGMPIVDRFRYRAAPGAVGHPAGRPQDGAAAAALWLRFADGREPDLLGLACLVDALAPAVAILGVRGWTPTLELTVHLRAQPRPGWLRVAVRTRYVQGGLFEEDAEVWDAGGSLVAQSRQLAALPR